MTRLTVHIDRLVLAGFDRPQQKAIAEQLQRALAAHLATPTARAHILADPQVTRLAADRVRVAPGAESQELAERIAGRIALAIAPVRSGPHDAHRSRGSTK